MSSEFEPLPTWCAGEAWCPITASAAIIGKKWHLVIVDRLIANDPLRFSELEASIDGISGKVLSESLTDLEAKGLVSRTVLRDKPVGVEYSLTPHGRGLEEPLEALYAWGTTYLTEVHDPARSIV